MTRRLRSKVRECVWNGAAVEGVAVRADSRGMNSQRRRSRRGRYALILLVMAGGGAWWPYRHELPPMGKAPWGPKEAAAQPEGENQEPVTVEEKRLNAMQRLGEALARYTDRNGGKYPLTLRTLTEEGYLPANAAESLWGPKGFLLQY